MQLSTLVLCALAVLAAPTLTAAAAEGTARVHVHQTRVHERSVDGAVESRAKMFERIAHMKETPWDSDDAQKAAKCDDFCLLQSFWEFQLARNCVNRPTGLCTPYKLGLAGLEAVVLVADCDCDSASGSGSNSTVATASSADSASEDY
jgi:hypothetical protein